MCSLRLKIPECLPQRTQRAQRKNFEFYVFFAVTLSKIGVDERRAYGRAADCEIHAPKHEHQQTERYDSGGFRVFHGTILFRDNKPCPPKADQPSAEAVSREQKDSTTEDAKGT
jgi:hypothetical protein